MIIGLSGSKQSGKTTTANILSELGYEHRSFARKLKAICADLFNLTQDQVDGGNQHREVVLPEWGITSRQILQRMGTEVGRSVHPEVWIRYALRGVQPSSDVVISDVRFDNEAEAVRRLGGIIVQVNRQETYRKDDHDSEVGLLLPPDFIIENDGTLDDLNDAVQAILLDAYGFRSEG